MKAIKCTCGQTLTGLCGPIRMWALAPSQAEDKADRGGVPSRSVIRSSWEEEELLKKPKKQRIVFFHGLTC